jgi:WD40 repeat protein
MARFRQGYAFLLSLLWVAAVQAAEQSSAETGLYNRPVLVVDPGMHTDIIKRAALNGDGRLAVTGSDDKTVRIWSFDTGALLRTIRLPAGPGDQGKVYAVAVSPDGALIAAGGWTRATSRNEPEQIFLFERASSALAMRIGGLPNAVNHLTFSPDGRQLAATLGSGGIRLFDRDQHWAEVARDDHYDDQSYWAAFAMDGRLVTTAWDGKVRLYAANPKGSVRPSIATKTPGDLQPYGTAFSPDGLRLVVGYDVSVGVTLLDGHTLAKMPGPDLKGITGGDLGTVAWAIDGRTVFAGGLYQTGDRRPVLAWSDGGAGKRRILPAAQNTVTGLGPLPGGDLLVATADPWLGRLRADGTTAWSHKPPQNDFSDQFDKLLISDDGARIGFSFATPGRQSARFDLTTPALTLDPPPDSHLASPRQQVFRLSIGTTSTIRQLVTSGWSWSRTTCPAALPSIRRATASCWARNGH